jgi:hypothetical protein
LPLLKLQEVFGMLGPRLLLLYYFSSSPVERANIACMSPHNIPNAVSSASYPTAELGATRRVESRYDPITPLPIRMIQTVRLEILVSKSEYMEQLY